MHKLLCRSNKIMYSITEKHETNGRIWERQEECSPSSHQSAEFHSRPFLPLSRQRRASLGQDNHTASGHGRHRVSTQTVYQLNYFNQPQYDFGTKKQQPSRKLCSSLFHKCIVANTRLTWTTQFDTNTIKSNYTHYVSTPAFIRYNCFNYVTHWLTLYRW